MSNVDRYLARLSPLSILLDLEKLSAHTLLNYKSSDVFETLSMLSTMEYFYMSNYIIKHYVYIYSHKTYM